MFSTGIQEKPMTTEPTDRVIYRAELMEQLNVGTETIRRWMLSGKLPKPDIDLSRKTRGWKRSTLQAAGIGLI
jgi:predicted DNA-binding transcriptional regulator AlpA